VRFQVQGFEQRHKAPHDGALKPDERVRHSPHHVEDVESGGIDATGGGFNATRGGFSATGGGFDATRPRMMVHFSLGRMMTSMSLFGRVGCGRPLRGTRRQRDTTAHNPS
jgi:hypothetical protein